MLFIFFNQYWDWYFSAIYLLLISPIFFVCYWFFYNAFGDKTKSDRRKLKWGCVIIIVVEFVSTLWRILYVAYIYPEHSVYEGIGDYDDETANYAETTKREYIFIHFFLAVFLIVVFIIFYFACETWEEIGEEDPEESEKEDDKSDDKKDEDKDKENDEQKDD